MQCIVISVMYYSQKNDFWVVMDLPSYVSSAIGVSVEVKDLIMTYNGIVTPHFQDLAELPTSQRLAWTLSETAIVNRLLLWNFFFACSSVIERFIFWFQLSNPWRSFHQNQQSQIKVIVAPHVVNLMGNFNHIFSLLKLSTVRCSLKALLNCKQNLTKTMPLQRRKARANQSKNRLDQRQRHKLTTKGTRSILSASFRRDVTKSA